MTTLKLISKGSTPCEHCNSGIQSYVGTGKGGIQSYLEHGNEVKKDRALAQDFINVKPSRQHDWARYMDETRHNYGNDRYRRWKSDGVDKRGREHKAGDLQPRVMWYHYTISPDPRDEVDLATLRRLATSWARRFFGDSQVAIVYHQDNRNHIMHAHVVVNNTNILTGNRIHIDKKTWHTMNSYLQRESKNLGLSWLEEGVDDSKRPDKGASRAGRVVETMGRGWVLVAGDRRMAQAPEKRKAVQDRTRRMRQRRVKTEDPKRKRGKRGYEVSWKQEIREWTRVAVTTCDGTWAGYVMQMERLGVRVESKRRTGDVTYVHPNGMKVRGRTLGERYDVSHVKGEMVKSLAASGALGEGEMQRLIANARSAAVIETPSGLTVEDIERMKKACGCTLADIAGMLNAASAVGARSIEDLEAARDRFEKWGPANGDGIVTETMRRQHEARIASLDGAIALARKTHAIPETAPRRRSKADRGDVPLSEKIKKGYRLSEQEYTYLKEKDPAAFRRWRAERAERSKQRARREISEGWKRIERRYGGGARGSSPGPRSGGPPSRPAPSRSR